MQIQLLEGLQRNEKKKRHAPCKDISDGKVPWVGFLHYIVSISEEQLTDFGLWPERQRFFLNRSEIPLVSGFLLVPKMLLLLPLQVDHDISSGTLGVRLDNINENVYDNKFSHLL